jgi:hypothetical protein
VSLSRPLIHVLIGLATACAGAAALVGGLYLRGSGLIALAITGALAACLAAGITREAPGPRRISPLDAAIQFGGCTMLVILVLAGTAILSSGVVASVVGAVFVGAGAIVAVRSVRRAVPGRAAMPSVADLRAAPIGPVAGLSTRDLGREWLLTNGLLACALQPAAREALVLRRQETLDELERRDPEGFARWLSQAGPTSDPADFVQGERIAGTDAA